MKIRVEHVAMLAVAGLPPDGVLELDAGTAAGAVLARLHLTPAHQRVVALFINGRRAHATTPLQEGDQLFLGLPMGGG